MTTTRRDLSTAPSTARLAPPQAGTLIEGYAARAHESLDDALQYESGPELRSVDEVKKIVAMLPGVVVKRGHDSGPVIGKVIGARFDAEAKAAVAQMLITSSAALDEIRRGVTALSLGYNVIGGGTGHQRIDSIFELAVLEAGRCGPQCRVRADQRSEVEIAAQRRSDIMYAWTACCDACAGGDS